MGIKGLQKYKQMSANMNSNPSNINRKVNNQTQISMNIENQLNSGPQERSNMVRTSHSHSRQKSLKESSREVEEYRIRQINDGFIPPVEEYTSNAISNEKEIWMEPPT